MATATLPPPGSPVDLSGDPRRLRRERTMGIVFFAAAAMSLLISALILVSLFSNGLEFFADVDWSRVFGSDSWAPRRDEFGITTILVGSLIVTGIAMLVAAPLGLGAAIYLSEYARPGIRTVLKPILEVLAGIPSVVLGVFALNFIAPEVVGTLFGEDNGRGSMMAAGIGVGILTIPLVASVSEDAMRAVPNSLREASAGVGARRMSTTLRVVLPAAVSGIVAALILGASRAIGETMVVFIAGGASDSANYTTDPFEGTLTVTAAMASLAVGSAERAGISQGIVGSFWIAVCVVVIAFPLGIGAAIYLEEYAPRNRLTSFIELNIRNLAGVPSVVYGLLGLAIFVNYFSGFAGAEGVDRRTLAAAGITLAVLVMPIVIITTAEAIRAVPQALREGAYGVGATRWEVIRSQVLPYAAPGILTGALLSIARAVGEAAPLIVVGAVTGFFSQGGGLNVGNVVDPSHLRERFVALPSTVTTFAKLPEDEFKVANASATIIAMLVFVLLINSIAIVLRNRFEKKRSA